MTKSNIPPDWREDPIRVWTRRIMTAMMLLTVLIVWFVAVVKFIEFTLL